MSQRRWSKNIRRGFVVAVAGLVTAGGLGCGGARPRPLARLPRQLCQRASKQVSPTVLAVGSTSEGPPDFTAGSLVPVHYTGCAMRIVHECTVLGGYSFVPLTPGGQGDLRQIMNATDLAVGAPNLTTGLGLGLGSSEAVGVESITRGRWQAPDRVITTDMLQGRPECRSPGYVTHVIRAADVGAWAVVRDQVSRLQGQATLFGIGAGRSSGSITARGDFSGDPRSCWSHDVANCSAPVRYYLSRVEPAGTQPVCGPGLVPENGTCVPDVNGVLQRARWHIVANLYADGCVDGWGACELGYTMYSMGRVIRTGRGLQDSNTAGPVDVGLLPARALQTGWHLSVSELDEFQNDALGECDLNIPTDALFESAKNHTPLLETLTCGEVRVQVQGQPF